MVAIYRYIYRKGEQKHHLHTHLHIKNKALKTPPPIPKKVPDLRSRGRRKNV